MNVQALIAKLNKYPANTIIAIYDEVWFTAHPIVSVCEEECGLVFYPYAKADAI